MSEDITKLLEEARRYGWGLEPIARGFLQGRGVPTARFAWAHTLDDAVAAADDIGWPVVVKVVSGVLDRNWLHVRDGSGSAQQGDHDLVVTTTDTVKKGETVLVDGVVQTDRDFGSGYRYAVLVEQAKVSSSP